MYIIKCGFYIVIVLNPHIISHLTFSSHSLLHIEKYINAMFKTMQQCPSTLLNHMGAVLAFM